MWAVVNFGKWTGKDKTLPQILMSDPDWFFWAVENSAFKSKALATQAEMLKRRALSIKIPASQAPNDRVQYWFSTDGKFARIDLIQSTQPAHVGSSSELRRPNLNMAFPRTIKGYDKLGYKLLLASFKYYWFDKKPFTKARVEAFFSDRSNFNNP